MFFVQVAPIPQDIQDRRVEITGPVDRKMVINALNSGASVFMADFEDSNAPTWWAFEFNQYTSSHFWVVWNYRGWGMNIYSGCIAWSFSCAAGNDEITQALD